MWVSSGIKLRCSIHPLPSFKKLRMHEARQEDTAMLLSSLFGLHIVCTKFGITSPGDRRPTHVLQKLTFVCTKFGIQVLESLESSGKTPKGSLKKKKKKNDGLSPTYFKTPPAPP